MTVRNSLAIQQRLQDVGGQTAYLGFLTDLVHDLIERPKRTGGQLAQPQKQQELKLATFLKGRFDKGTCRCGINFDGDRFCCHGDRPKGATLKVSPRTGKHLHCTSRARTPVTAVVEETPRQDSAPRQSVAGPPSADTPARPAWPVRPRAPAVAQTPRPAGSPSCR